MFSFLPSFTHRHTHTNTHGRTPLDEWSARRRGRCLHNTQQTQETNIHVLSGIRTRDPSSQAAADPRIKVRAHWSVSDAAHGHKIFFPLLVMWHRTLTHNAVRQIRLGFSSEGNIASVTLSYCMAWHGEVNVAVRLVETGLWSWLTVRDTW